MARDSSGYFFFDFEAHVEGSDIAAKFGELICGEMNWPPGYDEQDPEYDEYYLYRFFVLDSTSQNAEEEFKKELFERLDGLTEPRRRLYDLCVEAVQD